MDTSQEYIDMCRKAVEIQWLMDIEREGDYFCVLDQFGNAPFMNRYNSDMGMTTVQYTQIETIGREIEKPIWLPRQDQLQEMGIDKKTSFGNFVMDFSQSVLIDLECDQLNDPYSHCDTFEKLWLIYVMMGFNKQWNGEDWVEAGK